MKKADPAHGVVFLERNPPDATFGRVVVLSSCRSASETVLRGEGVLGLARASSRPEPTRVLQVSGPCVRDDDSAALFDSFYKHLGQGESVAAALRAAQRERAEEGAPLLSGDCCSGQGRWSGGGGGESLEAEACSFLTTVATNPARF